jgi:hypothetical protein
MSDQARGPWHIVSRSTGLHVGPFTTELDCVMARSIARNDWQDGMDMDREAFDKHLWDDREGDDR